MELWITIAHLGYPNYSVSDTGRIRNDKRTSNLEGSVAPNGYKQFSFRTETGMIVTEYVHRIILMAFKGRPPTPDMTVDHINRNKTDNRLINLRWATRSEQSLNSTFSPNSIGYKKVEQRNLDGTLIQVWDSRIEAANALGLSDKSISNACNGLRKKNMYGGFIWTNPSLEIYEGEIWKPCVDPNFQGFYISSIGRIKTKRNKITYGAESNGYKMTSVYVNGVRTTRKVHCLMAESFFGRQELLVNHKDGNKSNNRIENLEYVTYAENAQHAHDTGLHPGGKRKAVIQYDLQGNEIARFTSITDAEFAIKVGDVGSVISGKCKTAGGYIWKSVEST